MTARTNTAEGDLLQLVIAFGRWFDGFGKFAAIVNGRCDELDSGQQLMIQRLAKESHQIDKFFVGWRQRYQDEAIRQVRQRLLDEEQVGAALNATPEEFWTAFLHDDEREFMPGGYTKEKAFDLCLWGPIEGLFRSPHRLSHLNDDIGAELLCAAVDDGVVSVRIGESMTPVVMVGRTPRMIDALSLAEVLDTQVECEVLIGGMGIQLSDKIERMNRHERGFNAPANYGSFQER